MDQRVLWLMLGGMSKSERTDVKTIIDLADGLTNPIAVAPLVQTLPDQSTVVVVEEELVEDEIRHSKTKERMKTGTTILIVLGCSVLGAFAANQLLPLLNL